MKKIFLLFCSLLTTLGAWAVTLDGKYVSGTGSAVQNLESLTEGYYAIFNANSDRYGYLTYNSSNIGYNHTMTDGTTITSTNYAIYVAPDGSGNYTFRLPNDKYIPAVSRGSSMSASAASATATSFVVSVADASAFTFNIKNTGNDQYWNANGPASFNPLCGWDGGHPIKFYPLTIVEASAEQIEAANKALNWTADRLQSTFGAITDASQYSSNATQVGEGSIDALLDGEYSTYFHSCWSNGPDEDHYLQADLGEGKSLDEFYIYYKRRHNTNNNRPTSITVSGSNDGSTFTTITTLTSSDANPLPTSSSVLEYLSDEIISGTAYRYLRFTVTATNTGATNNNHVFFHFSEFYILPGTDNVTNALTLKEKAALPINLTSEDITAINTIDAMFPFSVNYNWNITSSDQTTDGWAALRNAPAGIIALSSASGLENTFSPMYREHDITLGNNTLTATFKYTSGSHRIQILGVDLLDSEGNIVACDYHFGYAGGMLVNNKYGLKDFTPGNYKLRFIVNQYELTSSQGTITVENSSSVDDVDWAAKVASDITPWYDSEETASFTLSETGKTALETAGYTTALTSCDQAKYIELSAIISNNITYPTTGSYRIKNKAAGQYLSYGTAGKEGQGEGLITEDNTTSTVYLNGSYSAGYKIASGEYYVKPQTNTNTIFPMGTESEAETFMFTIVAPGEVNILGVNSYNKGTAPGTICAETTWAAPYAVISWQASSDKGIWTVLEAAAVDKSTLLTVLTYFNTFLPQITFGLDLGEYSGTTQADAETTVQNAQSVYDNASATQAEVDEQVALLQTLATTIHINIPATGKFYRIKGHSTNKYLKGSSTAGAAVPNSEGTETSGSDLWYYGTDNCLINYHSGLGLIGTKYVAAVSETKETTTFQQSQSTASDATLVGVYEILSNYSGSKYWYSNTNNLDRNSVNNNAKCEWDVELVTSLPFTISGAGWATLNCPAPVKIPTGVTAYTGTVNGDYFTLTALTDGIIPAGTPVILSGTANTYDLVIDYDNGDAAPTQDLSGTIGTEVVSNILTLQMIDEIGLYKYNETELAGFKAYLSASKLGTGVKGLAFQFNDATAIKGIAVDSNENATIYNLAGQRVSRATKGIYVINGKKVVIK